jgi:5'-3' exonuclease
MGIVRFYSWLKNKSYRGVLIHSVPQYVSSFCLDFNGIIHKVAQIVYAYGLGENPARRKLIEKTDPSILEAEFYTTLGTKLSELIAAVQPQDTFVLAVDGVAPQAKIAQQRQRRYRAALDSSGKVLFNSSSITPGTNFMMRLDNFLQRWLVSNSNILPGKVIYSSHMVPGEDEHKIYDMIRKREITGDGANVIYGMDADLIMLSMLSPMNSIFLMREDIRDVINIDNLKLAINQEYKLNTSIQDFVIMIFLIGNDFLPHMPALNNMEESIETMRQVYIKNGKSLVQNSSQINWENLSSYLSMLSNQEPNLLQKESQKNYKYPSRMLQAATSKKESLSTEKTGTKISSQTKFDFYSFRGFWYQNCFELKGNKNVFSKMFPNYNFGPTNNKIVDMVKSYLTGIEWVFRYYNLGIEEINTDYVYRYLYAPLILDISLVSKKYEVKPNDVFFNENALIINPVHQLLAVLPLSGKKLLPEEVQHLMNSDSMIGDYYPENEIIERDGYNEDWEGKLLVNFVDMERIIDAVEKTSVFSPSRLHDFSPVLNISLVKDPETIALEKRTRKMKSYPCFMVQNQFK